MTSGREAQPSVPPAVDRCWCCGGDDDPALMVHLGEHPEVAVCRPCARWAAKQADEIDDRDHDGLAVYARHRARDLRRRVVDRGWHRHPILGGPLRRLGRYLP